MDEWHEGSKNKTSKMSFNEMKGKKEWMIEWITNWRMNEWMNE